LVRGEKLDCAECRKLLKQSAFPAGTQVRIVLECETCPLAQTIPIPENEQILDLYQGLPQTFDAFGTRIVDLDALKLVFELNGVFPGLQDDYARRILYFNSCLLEEKALVEKEKGKREKSRKK